MNRREFLVGGGAAVLAAGCCSTDGECKRSAIASKGAGMLFGACRGPNDVKTMKSVGYDFWEWGAGNAFIPEKGEEEWKRQRELILSQPLPMRSCNGFIPGKFRLTGPKADHEPALKYAETVLRRADEIGVKTIVFGSSGARNVPGDYLAKDRKDQPDVEKGTRQYEDFCRELCKRTDELKTVQVVIEPLRPNESNIINFVWQGVNIVKSVGSPRLRQLADIFHMMMGFESADSIVQAGELLKHCHIADYGARQFPGHDAAVTEKLRPYFDALRKIGYTGGVSCECGWGNGADLAKNLETALKTMRGLANA